MNRDIINRSAKILFEQDFPNIKFDWFQMQPTAANERMVENYIHKAENLFERLNLNLETL